MRMDDLIKQRLMTKEALRRVPADDRLHKLLLRDLAVVEAELKEIKDREERIRNALNSTREGVRV
jgi:hypothetical protein